MGKAPSVKLNRKYASCPSPALPGKAVTFLGHKGFASITDR